MDINERTQWAFAIAERISDKWDGARQFSEDAATLRVFLEKALFENIEALKTFWMCAIVIHIASLPPHMA